MNLSDSQYYPMRAEFAELTAQPTPTLVQLALKEGAECRASFPAHRFALEIFKVRYGAEVTDAFYAQFRRDLKLMMMVHFTLEPHFIYPAPVLEWTTTRDDATVDENWLVFNAPRPLNGHARAVGDFVYGVFYSALDPIEYGAEKTLKTILEDDGKLLYFIDDESMTEIVRLYVASLRAEYTETDLKYMVDDQEPEVLKSTALSWYQKYWTEIPARKES